MKKIALVLTLVSFALVTSLRAADEAKPAEKGTCPAGQKKECCPKEKDSCPGKKCPADKEAPPAKK